MSHHGAPTFSTDLLDSADQLHVAIIASSWHAEVMDGLIAGAQRACTEVGAATTTMSVPGSFELPVMAQAAARAYDAVVALGVVVRGGTPHFDYVCQAATDGLARVALDSGKPVGFGMLTCDDHQQAVDRAGLAESREDKGYEAATAAVHTALALRSLNNGHRF